MLVYTRTASLRRASDTPYEQEPISYSDPQVADPVAALQKQLQLGRAKLDYEPAMVTWGGARALDIPESSQTLVFSKTSFQRDRIAPRDPRAVYFNDDVYIGWVQGGEVVEVSAVDPRKGRSFIRSRSSESDCSPVPPAYPRMPAVP